MATGIGSSCFQSQFHFFISNQLVFEKNYCEESERLLFYSGNVKNFLQIDEANACRLLINTSQLNNRSTMASMHDYLLLIES
jgi:hypothetical protein